MLNIIPNIILVDDVMFYILNNVTCPTIYMNCLCICKNVYVYLMKSHEDKIKSFNLGIFGLWRRYPLLNWDVSKFSYNISLRVRDVLSYHITEHNKHLKIFKDSNNTVYDKYMNVRFLDFLPLNIIREIMKDKSINTVEHFMWFIEFIPFFNNPHITFEDKFVGLDIMSLSKLNSSYLYVSLNPNVTIKIAMDNLNYPWSWEMLTYNNGITINDIVNNSQLP